MTTLADLKARSRELRKTMTDAEWKVWGILRNRSMMGYRFLRQHPVGNYIVDFYCRELGLVIEVDGGQHAHDDNEIYDQARTSFLHSKGLAVVRFWNTDAIDNLEGCYQRIAEYIDSTSDSTHPTLPSEEGRDE